MITTLHTYSDELNNFENPYSFPLDSFQMHTIDIVRKNEPYNIIITAPTGAGKSLPAEFIIQYNYSLGKRTIFASPVKALSNQKLFDFKNKFPHISFGLITGDYKSNPFADCIIMTTEILLNAINKQSDSSVLDIDLSNVHTVIFDEAHMINNIERGKVWEQCFIKLNININQVLLSATLGNPEALATCINKHNKHKTYILIHNDRPVPLHFSVYYTLNESVCKKLREKHNVDALNKLIPLMNTNNKIFSDTYYQTVTTINDIVEKLKINTISQVAIVLNMIKFLTDNNMTPCLFFILSKNKILQLVEYCSTIFLTTSNEQIIIRDKFDMYLHKSNVARIDYESSLIVQTVKAYAIKGYAYHHSGLLPILKEIVELLYGEGLIKVLFATETFSVGLNMPTKTVIFCSLSKYDGQRRYLDSAEFIQMAGRAGRRGLDDIGHVIILPQFDLAPTLNGELPRNKNKMLTCSEVRNIFTGKPLSIISKYNIDPIYVLRNMIMEIDISSEIKSSLWFFQQSSNMQKNEQKLNDLKQILKEERFNVLTNFDQELAQYHSIINSTFKLKNQDKLISDLRLKIPQLNKTYELWKQSNDVKCEVEALEYDATVHNNIVFDYIQYCQDFLFEHGFIEIDYTITILGKLANALGSEGNPLLIAKMMMNENIMSLTHIKLASLFAMFCVDRNMDYISTDLLLRNGFEMTDEINTIFIDNMAELRLTIDSTWTIGQNYMDIAQDWMNNMPLHELINKYDIFEGDFVKNMLKLDKIIERVISTAIEFNMISIADTLQTIKPLIVKGVVCQESIYLTL